MRQWLKSCKERWDNWCGDREMEQAIRTHLTREGFFGRTAKLRQVRLVAIARPGWKQVFRFEARARVASAATEDGPDPAAVYCDLFGLVQEDTRHRTTVVVFERADQRRAKFAEWSDGLLCLGGLMI